ncbi:MAG: helix-turn-helix transcriptional regulator [Clostridia bacterium]|nr:helix-turn-helix transcriptional regulator [Clostridia bacterium]
MGFLEDYGQNTKMVAFHGAYRMRYTHIHPHFELCFCVNDVEQMSVVNGAEYVYKYPSVVISSPYTLHSMSSIDTSTDKFDRYVLYFGENTLNAFDKKLLPIDIFQRNTWYLFKLTVEDALELKKIFELYRDNSTPAEQDLIFAMIVNRLMTICPPDSITKVGLPSFYIQDVFQYISENFMDGLDIADISKQFAVSRSKLDRDFKKFAGITVHSYMEMCRLNQAKFLLEYQKNISISDIALMCGFKSENYFFPFFKKTIGKTPSEYRKERN